MSGGSEGGNSEGGSGEGDDGKGVGGEGGGCEDGGGEGGGDEESIESGGEGGPPTPPPPSPPPHGQLGSDTPQHRRAARIFEWGGFVPIWSDLLRGSARRRSFYLSSWGCSSVSPAFGVWLPTSRVWMEKMTHRRPERTRGARGTRAHPQSRVRDVGWLPVRLPDRLPVEVLRALLCVATGAGAAFESHRKIEKSFSNSF
mgnify:CR=1 FL=1